MNLLPGTYLTSHILSPLGNSIAGTTLPIVVLSTTSSALGAGTVAAATAIPAVLDGLFMRVVIDRINRRTSSVVTDLISAASIAARRSLTSSQASTSACSCCSASSGPSTKRQA
ncbi:hypothetical protein [Pseudoclavibacter helvolus]|uniref:hypothetical protein n=1 Tax=Pseudoclavibacter helvolus TaxID=255205 RepID=UPI003C75F9DE